jgi:hypothetical protein
MEELHKIHKDVPFGYWVVWVEPAFRALTRRWRKRREPSRRRPATEARLIGLR